MRKMVWCVVCVFLAANVGGGSALGASSHRRGNVQAARAITNSYVVTSQKGTGRSVRQVQMVDPSRIEEQSLLQESSGRGKDAVYGSDVFTRNRLISPLCSQMSFVVLSVENQRNCAQTGITSAPAPISNLQFDKIVDTTGGPADLVPKPDGIFSSIILTLMNVLWSVTLHVTHAVFFAIEWAFGFNLATNGVLQQVGKVIGGVAGRVTLVFMGVGSAACGIWILWIGGVRRQTSRAMKHGVQVFLVITATLVVLANPVGTIGQVSGFSSQIGTWLLSVFSGNLSDDRIGLENANQALYRGVVLPATAQMMFGNVDFGANPKRLNPTLKTAARKLAKHEPPAIQRRVETARTNVELFAIWKANSPQRTQFGSQDDTPVDGIGKYTPAGAAVNVLSDALSDDSDALHGEKSLLAALCDSGNPRKCKSQYSDIVSWQTEDDVGDRVVGFILVSASLLVFCLLCGSIALTLLAANVMMVVHLLQLAVASALALFGSAGFHRMIDISKHLLLSATAAIGCGATLGIITSLWTVMNQIPGLGFLLSWLLITISMVAVFRKRKTLWGAKSIRRNVSNVVHQRSHRLVDRVRPAPRLAQRTAYGMAVGFGGSPSIIQHLPTSPFSSLGIRRGSRSSLQEKAQRYTHPTPSYIQPAKQQTKQTENHYEELAGATTRTSNETNAVKPSEKETGVARVQKFAAGVQPVIEGYAVGGFAGGVGAAGATMARTAAAKRLDRQQETAIPPTIPPKPQPKPAQQQPKNNHRSHPDHRSISDYYQQQQDRQARLAHRRETHLATQDQKIPSSLPTQRSENETQPIPKSRETIKQQPAASQPTPPKRKDVQDRVTLPPAWQQLKRYSAPKDERE